MCKSSVDVKSGHENAEKEEVDLEPVTVGIIGSKKIGHYHYVEMYCLE